MNIITLFKKTKIHCTTNDHVSNVTTWSKTWLIKMIFLRRKTLQNLATSTFNSEKNFFPGLYNRKCVKNGDGMGQKVAREGKGGGLSHQGRI